MTNKDGSKYSWEKNTKGIGRKLLDKFGFKGRLGAHEDGVSSAIEVQARPGSLGLGYGDFKEAPSLLNNKKFEAEWRGKEFEEEDDSAKSVVEKMAASKSWKKSTSKRRLEDVGMINVEDLISQAKENTGIPRKQVIVDMRGSETRIITDLSNISSTLASAQSGPPKFGEEFLYNVNLMVDLSEMSLAENAQKLKFQSNRIQTIETDLNLLERMHNRDADRLNRLQRVEKVLDRIQERLCTDISDITVESIVNLFQTLHTNFQEEFKLFGLVHLLPSLSTPILRQSLSVWNPLTDPHVIADVVLGFEPLLISLDKHGDGATARELLHRTVEDLALPAARRALTNEWQATDAAAAVDLMETLRVAVTSRTFDDLISTTVMPKIQTAVSRWSPTSDPIPIHSWILPWLPLLKSTISVVFPEIRRKLGHALAQWHPSDGSALAVLQPWMGVFDQSSMDQLLLRSIMPKLVTVLRELVINPLNQDLSRFLWVMAWADTIPRWHFVSLLEGEFFYRWMQVLVAWLNAYPDFEEVTNWYLGWKAQFTPQLLDEPLILANFNTALQLMSDSLSVQAGGGVGVPPGVAENVSYYRVLEQRNLEAAAVKRLAEMQRPAANRGAAIGVSFREVVEAFAVANEILFVPKEGKTHAGKPVWQFGTRSCIIDQNVVFYNNGQDWSPIALEDLLLASR